MTSTGTMMAVAVQASDGSSFVTGPAETLFTGPYYAVLSGRSYDVSPDGKRFLMIKDAASPSATIQLMVVQNWDEELKRLVPNN